MNQYILFLTVFSLVSDKENQETSPVSVINVRLGVSTASTESPTTTLPPEDPATTEDPTTTTTREPYTTTGE